MTYTILKATRGFEMNMVYPQYKENYSRFDVISVATWAQIQQWALKRLNDKTFGPEVDVREHMASILDGNIPFGMRITSEVEC